MPIGMVIGIQIGMCQLARTETGYCHLVGIVIGIALACANCHCVGTEIGIHVGMCQLACIRADIGIALAYPLALHWHVTIGILFTTVF